MMSTNPIGVPRQARICAFPLVPLHGTMPVLGGLFTDLQSASISGKIQAPRRELPEQLGIDERAVSTVPSVLWMIGGDGS
jgi:hypothetical protein